MQIVAVERALPRRRVNNAWILEQIGLHNRDRMPASDLERLQRRISVGLGIAGTDTRFILDDDENASDLVLDAARRALTSGGIRAEELDFIIYTGVGRGCVEPAMASTIQVDLGARNATCFDVMDACASWLRALHIAHCYFKAGAYRRGLIVNCEAGFRSHVQWTFDSPDDLEHHFAAFTIGEAATATLVSNEVVADDFYFTFRTFGEHFPRCVIPQPSFAYFFPDLAAGNYRPGRFFARSHELFPIVTELIVDTWKADPLLTAGTYDVAFGHEASEKLSRDIASIMDIQEIYFPIHRRFGNVVSASVPLAMSLAQEEGRLARGDRVLVIVGSAGISVGFAAFTY